MLSLTTAPEPVGPPPQKSTALSFLISLVLPGMGQVYCGKYKRGIWTFIFTALCIAGGVLLAKNTDQSGNDRSELLLGLVLRTGTYLYVFAFVDAFLTAREVSSGQDRWIAFNPRVAAVLNLTTRGFGYFYLVERKKAWTVFIALGVLGRVSMTIQNVWLDFALEFLLIGLAIDAYRLARKMNPHDEAQRAAPIREERREFPSALVYGLAGIIVLVFYALNIWVYAAPDFRAIDQSQAKFEVKDGQSTYHNPKYGLTVRLTGNWEKEATEKNNFCELRKEEEALYATVTADSMRFLQSPRGYEENLLKEMRTTYEVAVVESEDVRVGAERGRRLVLRYKHGETDITQAFLLMRRRLGVYLLIVTAPRRAEENLLRLAREMHQSLEVR